MNKVMLCKSLIMFIVILFFGISVVSSGYNLVEKSYISNIIYSPHAPIYINGNNDFTIENGVTRGSGSSNDPYIIEDWEINASYQDGITIRNASVYFKIIKCCVYDGGKNNDGIVFINVTNGSIEDAFITENRNGIMFRTQYIGKENSEYNIILCNNITSNNNDGIHFEHTGWGYHNHNMIIHNNLSDNNRGIYMIMSAYNQIVSNNVLSNDEVGIKLDMCGGGGEFNKIYHNNFVNNEDKQAFEMGNPINSWDDDYPSGGNFWSDYNGTDNNGDGIGDTPYYIQEGNNKDRYPLMEPWGGLNLPPNKPIIDGPTSGKPGTLYNFTLNAVDPDDNDVRFIIDWDDTNTETTDFVGSGENKQVSHTWTDEGTYTITAKAEDEFGFIGPEATYTVTMPRNRAIQNIMFLWFLERYPQLNRFLILLIN